MKTRVAAFAVEAGFVFFATATFSSIVLLAATGSLWWVPAIGVSAALMWSLRRKPIPFEHRRRHRVTGRIVQLPASVHHCDVNAYGILHINGHDASLGVTPGTVWECGCDRTFVAQPWRAGEMFPRWLPESRFARWRRERRSLAPTEALATLEAALPANPDDHGPVAVPSDAIRILAKLRRRTAEPVAE